MPLGKPEHSRKKYDSYLWLRVIIKAESLVKIHLCRGGPGTDAWGVLEASSNFEV